MRKGFAIEAGSSHPKSAPEAYQTWSSWRSEIVRDGEVNANRNFPEIMLFVGPEIAKSRLHRGFRYV